MLPLHEELWLLIFKTVQNEVLRTDRAEHEYDNDRIESVLPLTKTCRNFHQICQPLLFETIVITHSTRAESLASVLQSKPHLRNAVSKVHIFPDSPIPSETWDRMEKALMELFSIRELWIWMAVISRTLADHIQQCPRLERLFLFEVSISDRETTVSSFRSLKHLRYKQGRTTCFTNLSLPNLETLHIDSEFIDSDHLSGTMEDHQIFQFDPAVLKSLIVSGPWYLSDSMQAGLLGLLGRTTQIRSLTLPQDEFNDSFNVPKDLIPNLEIFDGPVNLVLKFCKGRPIRDLRMSIPERGDWERKIDVPSLVTAGSVPLEHLSISGCEWEGDTMEFIARHCPELVSLKIRADRVTGTLSTRHPMPKLRNATLVSFYGEWYENDNLGTALASEERIVRDCKEFWTELEYLRLNRDYFWRYRGLEVERFEGKEVENPWYR